MDKDDLIRKIKEADTNDYPDFSKYSRPLDMALWVLWVAKDEAGERKLTGEQIASIIIETQEISANANSIVNALNRASDKVHRYYEDNNVYFEIMKPGKEYLMSLTISDLVNVVYFEPERKFTAKRLLKNQILENLTGNLKIVDPYCGDRTLDILESIKDRNVKLLTRVENLRDREKQKLLREITDFKTENPTIEIRNYPHSDIHDRYIISESEVVIIGHSIKDLGAKETFAIILDSDKNIDIYEVLHNNFNRRWNISTVI